MIINNVMFNADLSEILDAVREQLAVNNIQLLQKQHDSGTDIMIQCPYHGNGQERRPSAGIRKSDGLFHCFACNETHTLYELISYCFGHYDDTLGTYGWQWLLRNFATIAVERRPDVKIDMLRNNTTHKTDSSFDKVNVLDSDIDNQLACVTEEELNEYRYYHSYWKKRGIIDERIIELFDLGFDRKTACITFPVRDIKGRCSFVARRSVKTKYFNYPAGAEKPLYGLYEYETVRGKVVDWYCGKIDFRQWDDTEIIVVESMLDALSFWIVGKYAFALNGLGNELQFKQLRNGPWRKLILATDNDKAGMTARKRIKQNVKNKLITQYVFPENRKDANECTETERLNLKEIF